MRAGIHVGPLGHAGRHRAWWAAYALAGTMGDWLLVSVYGYPSVGPGPANRALIEEMGQWLAERGRTKQLVGGDWNLDPQQFELAGGRGAQP